MKISTLCHITLLFFCSFSYLFGKPYVTSIEPKSGLAAIPNSITLNGSGFLEATEVNFGNNSMNFIIVDDSTIIVMNPPNTHVPGAVTVTVNVGDQQSPPNHPYDYYTYRGPWLAYVTDFDSRGTSILSLFDIQLASRIATIPVQTGGNDIAITPDGCFIYCINSAANSITVINAIQPYFPIQLPLIDALHPIAIAITPNGKKAYIANYNSHNVSVLDLTNPEEPIQLPSINVGSNPTSIGFTPDGTTAYTTNSGSANLTKINVALGRTSFISTGTGTIPSSITFTPNNKMGFITNDAGNSVLPITGLNSKPVIKTPIFGFSFLNPTFYPEIVVDAQGTTAYVTCSGSNVITPINIASLSSEPNIFVQNAPIKMSLSPDGKIGYISNGTSNVISLIDLAKNSPTAINLKVGNTPANPKITPDQAPVAYFSYDSDLPNNEMAFDASESISPTGSIATYTWKFGDDSPDEMTLSPTITHQYKKAGSFQVTLIVTNTAGTSTSIDFTGKTVSRNGGPSAKVSQFIKICVFPPINVINTQTSDHFLTQICYDNLIVFSPPKSGPPPAAYRLYADKELTKMVAEIPASNAPSFSVCTLKKHVTFYIVSVGDEGGMSKPVSVTT